MEGRRQRRCVEGMGAYRRHRPRRPTADGDARRQLSCDFGDRECGKIRARS